MPEIKARSSLDSTKFNGGVDKMQRKVQTFSGQMNTMSKKLSSTLGPIAVAYAIGKIATATVRAASTFQDLTLQFKVLLGSGNEARKLFRDLVEFSAQTPFSLEEISKGSQQLLNLTEGLYGGVDSMRLFGDAIAATNKDMEGSTYWIGRLYAALASNQSIARAGNSLLRIKLLGPSVLKQMNEMQAAGKSSAEIWNVFTESLKKFEGGMAEMSETVSGKTSTMKDNWLISLSAMGTAFEPFTLSILNGLTSMAQGFTKFTNTIVWASKAVGAFSTGKLTWEEAKMEAERMMIGMSENERKGTSNMVPGLDDGTGGGGGSNASASKFRMRFQPDRLAKIGGMSNSNSGGIIGVMNAQARMQMKANDLLAKIERNTANDSAAGAVLEQ